MAWGNIWGSKRKNNNITDRVTLYTEQNIKQNLKKLWYSVIYISLPFVVRCVASGPAFENESNINKI